MTRDEILMPIVDAIRQETGLSKYRILRELEPWEAVEHLVDGQLAASAIVKGTEIHFAIAPAYRRRLIRKENTRAFLAPLMELRGFLTTRLKLEHAAERRFVERIGFVPTWSDGQFQYYLLDRLPFERKKK